MKDKLQSKIVKINNCWIWLGSKDISGYGYVGIGKGKVGRAHRISYQEFVGPIPAGFLVLHRCDNPSCINPEHLFVGTQKDNMQDMWKKGRGPIRNHKRDKNPAAKLNNEKVIEILKLLENGTQQKNIAKQFNVSEQIISRIKLNQSWNRLD